MSLPANNRRKDSDIQAADGSPDPELDSLIAPQGYDAETVDDIATMQTPQQQRRAAIRFMVMMVIGVAIMCWFCTPSDMVVPEFPEAPYALDERPAPPNDKFLKDAIPKAIGDFRQVDIKTSQVFEDPYVGAIAVEATYVDSIGNPVTVVMIEAESYINAKRYLQNYKQFLEERTTLTEWQEKLYIEDNFIQWAAPDFANRAYGLAWNNGRYFVSVTSPIQAAQQALAAEFPY